MFEAEHVRGARHNPSGSFQSTLDNASLVATQRFLERKGFPGLRRGKQSGEKQHARSTRAQARMSPDVPRRREQFDGVLIDDAQLINRQMLAQLLDDAQRSQTSIFRIARILRDLDSLL